MKAKLVNSIDKHVGSRVRMRRLVLGFSQTRLAEAIGITFQQVQKYENGRNRVGASRMQQIANFLQVPPAFFFEGLPGQSKTNGSASTSSYVTEFTSTRDGLALMKAFMLLKSATLKRAIVHLVEELSAR